MMEDTLKVLLEDLIKRGGLPRNVRTKLEEAFETLSQKSSTEEKISAVSSVLDEASSDPNLSISARTNIWNAISALEQ